MESINFESYFKDLFDNTSDLIHFLKLDGSIELVNPAWLECLQYTKEEIDGKNFYEFIDPEFLADYKLIREKSIQDKRNHEIETVFVTKKGTKIIVEGQIGCVYRKGVPIYTRSVFKNITGRRIAEKRLEDSERRLNTFFKSGPDAIIIINEDQLVVEWNPKAEQIFGFSATEAIGNRISEIIIPPRFRQAHERGMAHFLKTGEGPVLNKTIEISALHKSGYEFYINLSISNVQFGKGWLFIAFLSDISERKRTEEALIKKEAELLQSKIIEEKRDEFISIASHELKTPLTTIKAYTQLAIIHCKENRIEKVKEFLIKTDNHIIKINKLISELLDISKIHAGKLDLDLNKIELSHFLKGTLENIQEIISDHLIKIEKNDQTYINADTLRLEQVIINLITNAAKYSPGKTEIIVNSKIEDNYVIISIKDFGVGIPAGYEKKIFERFYRVDETSSHFNGLGIGLFISAEIIKQHNGFIWAISGEKNGSTFYIKIPLMSKY